MTLDKLYEILDSVGANSVRLKVFYYVLQHMNPDTHIFSKSYDAIARDLGASYSAVASAMRRMREFDCIEPVKQGVWRVTDKIKVYRVGEEPKEYKNVPSIEFHSYA